MRTTVLAIITCAAVVSACNSSGSKQPGDSVSTAEAVKAGEAGAACYQKVVGKDTFHLQLIVNEDKANGVLDYNFFEKDKNSGVIDGTLSDNILRATYHFQSEGQTSDRPVVFKVMGQQVYEALADNFDANGVPVFNADNSQLKFEPQPYNKVDCK
ncbi:hypothetical protein ACFOTA_07190 [Chitinophaga sp. GCM10012297]|uniref:Lipoprotein n=1 Tax=Chitinophaga chungangae TaxID=2821488 RepID=A0ABS3YBC6_9BACT|nr:hypothetical protein [Chitinophaga chungangae]MBO9151985.1 hypothetical protein [Chitinophaga chungangae]